MSREASLRWSRDGVVALVMAVVLVGVAIALRWNGARGGNDAWLPLRPLAAVEAAGLLNYVDRDGEGRAALVGLDDRKAVIGSSVYLLPARPDAAEDIGMLVAGGREYTLHSVSWGGFHSRYPVSRPALEAALGRALGPADLNTARYPAGKASFDQARVPWYALFETLLLAAVFWVLIAIRRLTGLASAALAAAAVVPFFLIFVVGFYSPAFGDADWFHQRILVEDIALYGIFVGPVLGILALPLLVAELYRAHARRTVAAGTPSTTDSLA